MYPLVLRTVLKIAYYPTNILGRRHNVYPTITVGPNGESYLATRHV